MRYTQRAQQRIEAARAILHGIGVQSGCRAPYELQRHFHTHRDDYESARHCWSELGRKGGIRSGEVRREKADEKKAKRLHDRHLKWRETKSRKRRCLRLRSLGWSYGRISKSVGTPKTTVYRWCRPTPKSRSIVAIEAKESRGPVGPVNNGCQSRLRDPSTGSPGIRVGSTAYGLDHLIPGEFLVPGSLRLRRTLLPTKSYGFLRDPGPVLRARARPPPSPEKAETSQNRVQNRERVK